MAVIINELEVVVEPPKEHAEAVGVERRRPDDSPPRTQLAPADIESVQRYHVERAARLWAH